MADGSVPSIRGAPLRVVELHPAKRWGALVGLALSCPHDLTTVGAWAREAGICETQLRLRCRLAGVPAKVSLDFTRVLRAALYREACGGLLSDYLDVGDDRTMRHLFEKAGRVGREYGSVMEYVSAQPVIREMSLIDELKKMLALSPILRSR